MLTDIKAVIYDMDGVLIDSEPLWRRAMIQSFSEIGVPFTDDDCRLTTGMRFIEVARFWFHRFNIHNISIPEFNDLVIHRLRDLIVAEGRPMPGVMESLSFFKAQGLRLAIGTSSSRLLVDTVVEKLRIGAYFEAVCSAETMRYGKPHPEIFLHCAEKLQLTPPSCLVIEDSVNGVIAGKAAQMRVLAVPDHENRSNPKFAIADAIHPSLTAFINEYRADKVL